MSKKKKGVGLLRQKFTEEQLNDKSFIQDQLRANNEALAIEADWPKNRNEVDDWPDGPNFKRHESEMKRLMHEWHALEELLLGEQQPTGVKMNLTREDGVCLFVEENAKKFPAAPLRAILIKQKGKLERGNLGDLECFYFRYIPHNKHLPEKFLEVNLWQEEIEDVLSKAESMLLQCRKM